MSTQFRDDSWPLARDSRLAAKKAAAAVVADGEPTSAVYLFMPQMSHRTRIYAWQPINWGVDGETLYVRPASNGWCSTASCSATRTWRRCAVCCRASSPSGGQEDIVVADA